MNKNAIIGIIVVVLVLVLALLGLNRPADEPRATETDHPTETEKESLGLSNIPTETPIYPEARVGGNGITRSEGENGVSYTIPLEVKGEADTVLDWYHTAFSENDWNIKSDKMVAMYRILEAEHANDLYGTVQATNGENGVVNISLRVLRRPAPTPAGE